MFCALILAAGLGTRMNNTKKQFFKLNGKMILEFSINTFLKAGASEIVVATNSEKVEFLKNFFKHNKKIKIVTGGSSRQQSAKNAFNACDKSNSLVLIHDAARPFIKTNMVKKLIQVATKTKAATLASLATDTIKIVENNKVQKTIDRKKIALIQTPQAFNLKLYEKAINFAEKSKQNFTDDCQLIENLGFEITIVENNSLNFKITTLLDLKIAEALSEKIDTSID